MGLYDRDYTRADFQSQYHYAPQMRFTFPRITPVVKWLLIINITVHVLKVIFLPQQMNQFPALENVFAIFPTSLFRALQFWRLITYQFLHWNGWHLFVNMLGLFFLGPTLERHWGSKKFLIFYLSCGVAGGLFYLLLVAVGFLSAGLMVGASGAILGLLAACAILFPQFVVIILLFPVPIRVAAIGFMLLYIINILARGENAGGDAAHLAGMAAGAGYVFSKPWRERFKLKMQAGAWEKKMAAERKLQVELDRILQKVHDSGIHSLSSKEKKILKKATEAERRRNKL
ncbi:MAG: rhomboid family intramembrane serine protease [Sedimentisphaerales bacterium]